MVVFVLRVHALHPVSEHNIQTKIDGYFFWWTIPEKGKGALLAVVEAGEQLPRIEILRARRPAPFFDERLYPVGKARDRPEIVEACAAIGNRHGQHAEGP